MESEFLGVNQRVEEVGPEADRDDEADYRFGHCDFSLQSVASDGVETHQGKEQNPDSQIDNVGHDMAPPNFTPGFCPLGA
jgi:hypothetical protein